MVPEFSFLFRDKLSFRYWKIQIQGQINVMYHSMQMEMLHQFWNMYRKFQHITSISHFSPLYEIIFIRTS